MSFKLSAVVGILSDLPLGIVKGLFKKDNKIVLIIASTFVIGIYVLSWYIIITGAALSGAEASNS